MMVVFSWIWLTLYGFGWLILRKKWSFFMKKGPILPIFLIILHSFGQIFCRDTICIGGRWNDATHCNVLKIGRLYDDIAFCYTVSRVCSYSSNLYVIWVVWGKFIVFWGWRRPICRGIGTIYTPYIERDMNAIHTPQRVRRMCVSLKDEEQIVHPLGVSETFWIQAKNMLSEDSLLGRFDKVSNPHAYSAGSH